MRKIKIKSSHLTPFGRLDGNLVSIVLDAVRPVLSTTDVRDVGHVYIASYDPGGLCQITDPFGQIRRAIQAGFPDLRADYHGIYKTGGEALYTALGDMSAAVSNADEVLVLGAEKMTHLAPAVCAGILSQREEPHDRAYGATLPALGALVTRCYLRKHRISQTALHQVAVKNHEHGAKNPNAHFQREISQRDVLASPLIADPLRRLHCAPTSDGAAAVLLSFADGEAWYRGWGKGTDAPLFQERGDISRFVATAEAAGAAQRMAGVRLNDVDIVEIHDAFTSFELINLEEMGFYPRGTAWKALEAGNLRINSRLAVNTSGGMKARGHPIGTTGIASSVEVHAQLTGRAGSRQHDQARLGMIQSVGGVSSESFVFIVDSVTKNGV